GCYSIYGHGHHMSRTNLPELCSPAQGVPFLGETAPVQPGHNGAHSPSLYRCWLLVYICSAQWI
ncbi:uncharacterized protein METZ01_LOCUS205045, partial [marine metagenome]